MSKNLLIVESPAKAKTIEKILGPDFIVKSSFGHVRDLEKGGLGIDVKNKFKPNYVVTPDKQRVVKELKELAKKAEEVWLATDEDREGEAISWHLCKVLGLDEHTTKRIVFREITKPAILKAVQTILEKEATNNIIGYSIDGKPITQELLDEELEASEQDFKNGNFLTHSQLKKEIKNWRPTKKK